MFSKEDLEKYRALKLMLGSAQFSLRGADVLRGADLLKWFESLEHKIAQDLLAKPQEAKNAGK